MCFSPLRALASPLFFFFNDTATTEIYTLSLHDALPISSGWRAPPRARRCTRPRSCRSPRCPGRSRSEEHTSELQSLAYLVCRLLLEKKNITEYEWFGIVVVSRTTIYSLIERLRGFEPCP